MLLHFSRWLLSLCTFLVVFLATPSVGQSNNNDRVLMCYYGSWAVYRPGLGKFDVEDIDKDLCTHIIYGFAGLKSPDNIIYSLDPYNDLYDNYGKGAYLRFTSLTEANPNLKALLAIGGWNEGSLKYSQMVSTAAGRTTFIDSCVTFLQKYKFDGLDLDWEYPTARGGAPQDKGNFVLLLDEMRVKFNQHGLLMTAAVSAGKDTIDAAYDISGLARNLDFVNLMTYDFHGAWEKFAHHHSPLYAYHLDNDTFLNVDFAVKYWLDNGLPREKLVLGMPLYGRCFTLDSADQHQIYSPASQPGQAGPYTRAQGFLGYNEICEKQQQHSCTVVRDKQIVSPYMYYDRQWCGYDDYESLKVKTLYLMSLELAGAMVWSIETDDFHGTCARGPFPLITTIRDVLKNGQPTTTTTTDVTSSNSTTTTTSTTTTPTTTTTTTPTTTTTTNPTSTTPSTTTTTPTTTTTTTPTTTPTTTTTTNPTSTTTSTTTTPTTTTSTTPTTTTTTPTTTTTTNPTSTTTSTTTTTPTTTTSTTPSPTTSPSIRCRRKRFRAHPSGDCTVSYKCRAKVGRRWKKVRFTCPEGKVFITSLQTCDYPENHPECQDLSRAAAQPPTSNLISGNSIYAKSGRSLPLRDQAKRAKQLRMQQKWKDFYNFVSKN